MSLRGVSDIVGFRKKDGRIVCIECKGSKGKVTPEQSAFLDDVRTAGGVAFVARSVTDVQKALGL